MYIFVHTNSNTHFVFGRYRDDDQHAKNIWARSLHASASTESRRCGSGPYTLTLTHSLIHSFTHSYRLSVTPFRRHLLYNLNSLLASCDPPPAHLLFNRFTSPRRRNPSKLSRGFVDVGFAHASKQRSHDHARLVGPDSRLAGLRSGPRCTPLPSLPGACQLGVKTAASRGKETDGGAQDVFAMLLAAHHPRIKLLGISTVFGNASLE